MKARIPWIHLWMLLCLAAPLAAQEHQHEQMQEQEEKQKAPAHTASGTSLEPQSAPHAMLGTSLGVWRLAFHANAFLVETQQSGPQGRDKTFGVNWLMVSLDRPAGRGTFGLRTMISLDPLTVTRRQYPLLFQTGETAFGVPLTNAQHPHDLVMELSARYTLPLAGHTTLELYAAPVGDPALGPTAFPHRTSAAEIPEAALGHHLQDSTHIAGSVMTVGLAHRWWRIEASAFHGREPDENRWNIDLGAPDSVSARLTLRPAANWAFQVSHGHLNEPEEHEAGDIDRTTASVAYNRPRKRGNWATTLVWGRNHKRPRKRGNLNSYLLESSLQFLDRNYVFGRVENVDREGLFLTGEPHDEPVKRIAAFTVGAARDLLVETRFRLALGFDVSLYRVPGSLRDLYDSHPVGARVFLRLRVGRAMSGMHHH